MQFQETCPSWAGEQCFSRPASSLTAHPDASRCLGSRKPAEEVCPGRASEPRPGSVSFGESRGKTSLLWNFAKKYSHTSMCTPVKTLRRTRAWRHPVQAVHGGGSTLTLACPRTWGAGESWLSSWAEPGFLVHVQLHSLKPVPSLTLRGKHIRSACMQKYKTTRIQKFW